MFHAHEIKGTIRPLQDWVILKPIKEAVRKRGGIVLPERTEDYGRCEVVAVGPGYRTYRDGVYGTALIPTELKVGEFVFLQKFVEGEMRFNLNGDKCFAVRERHLSLTVEGIPKL